MPKVVGLDISEPMLREARACSEGRDIRYVCRDFRAFDLGQELQAATCGGDSLNCLDSPEHLADVFRCVARHLSPGGFFAFDVLGQEELYLTSGTLLRVAIRDERFELYFFYNIASRVGEVRVVFEDAIEGHRRIPIDLREVRQAASEAGLMLTDQFSRRFSDGMDLPYVRSFYVLRKPGDQR